MKKTIIIASVLLTAVIAVLFYVAEKVEWNGNDSNKIEENSSAEKDIIVQTAGITPQERTEWNEFINNRVGCQFLYPKENLTRPITEVVKFPSIVEGEPRTLDVLEFNVGDSLFRIKTYVREGNATSTTLEDWIKEDGRPRISNNLDDYEKVVIAGATALRLKGKTFLYALVNDNIYEIASYRNDLIADIIEEPLYEKWVSTFYFFNMVECWKDGPGDPFKE